MTPERCSSKVQQPDRPTPDSHRPNSPLSAASTTFIDRYASGLYPGSHERSCHHHIGDDKEAGAVEALRQHKKGQAAGLLKAGALYHDDGLVFCYEDGQPYSRWALNYRFGKMTQHAGIGHWHAHEGRHTAVSIMSSNGVPIQEISDTVGHRSTHVTETVYRHVIVPAIRGGATVMDAVFGDADDAGDEDDQVGTTGAP